MRVCLLPTMQTMRPDNGIGRVLYAQHKYLPALGFELTTEIDGADLYVGHTQQFDMPRIDCLLLHGAYWLGDLNSGEYGQYHIEANAAIINAARKARAITVPSEWVAEPFKRDMRISPHVIGHGIDTADWSVGESRGYLLFGKNRMDDVCKPDAPYELAKRGLPVLSTFAPSGVTVPKNMQVTGQLPQESMRDVLRGADVYLATVKETFGIQTVEAMACGVPVAGWNYGGTADLVRNGVDGILVKPGDYDALERAVVEIQHKRVEFSTNARQRALQYDWSVVMKQYAVLFEQVYREIQDEPHGVSIVITGYNYGRYIGQAIDSALNQTRKPDEIIVVDDGSTDDTLKLLHKYIEVEQGVRIISQPNQGVAAARTTGLQAATQPYVTLLDADDKIAPTFIESLLPALESDRALGIAYSNMICFDDAGGLFETQYPPDFDWEMQATPHNPPANCIPSACLFRRDMWLRAGPHKEEYAPGEDAEFWTRGLATGFAARKVTTDKLFAYRLHESSATHTKQYRPIDDRLPWMRDKRYPLAAPSRFMPLIMSYSEPKVSIIVTVNQAQVAYLPDLVDSLTGQTMREWELIVIDDSGGDAWQYHDRYPFMRYHRMLKTGNLANARNAGLRMARAALVLFFDGNHMLTNSALEEMLTAHINTGGRYIYTDRMVLGDVPQVVESQQYRQAVWLGASIHALPALIPTDWAKRVGGFFPNLPAPTDDFYSRLALAGYCGQRLGRALIIERPITTEPIKPAVLKRIAKFMQRYEGVKMGTCCGGGGDAIMAAKQALQGMMAAPVPEGKSRLEFIGPQVGGITFFGKQRHYVGGNNDVEKYIDADEEDVLKLINSGYWKQMIVTQVARPVVTTTMPLPVAQVKAETVTASAGADVLINPDFDDGFDEAAERSANEAAAQLAQPAKAKRGGKR